MVASEQGLDGKKKIGLLSIIAFALAIAVILFFNVREPVFDPPYLQFILHAFFVFGSSIAIAVISVRAYLASGAINVLLLGSAIFVSGLSSTIASWTVSLSVNEAVTIGNAGIFFSSILVLASAITTMAAKSYEGDNDRKKILAAIYLFCLFLVVAISLAAVNGLTPVFLTPAGPTSIRLVILVVSIVLYIESASMFGMRYWRSKSFVVYWFSLALGLFSTALIAAVFVMRLGDVANWVSRLALYLSGVYLLIALLSRESKKEGLSGLSANWAQAFKLDPKQSETLFANMLNGFMYCKINTDTKGTPVDYTFLDVNNAYENIIGLRREEVLGKRLTDFFPSEPKELFIERYGRVALTGEPLKFEVYKESAGKWLNVSAYCPKKGYFVSIFEDITERKKAEEALAGTNRKIREILESIDDGFFSLDINWNYTYVNNRTIRAGIELGVGPDLVGKNFLELFPHVRGTVFEKNVNEAMTKKEVKRFEMRAIKPTGWREYSVFPSGEGVSVFWRDITDRKGLEIKLEEYSKKLELLVEEKTKQLKDAERLAAIGQTAGMVGHDIRNPLQAIVSDTYLLRTDLNSLNGDTKQSIEESLDSIEKNVDYINKIVQDLQDYARPIVPSAREIVVEEVIKDVLVKKAIPKNVEASYIIGKDASKVFADPTLLKRVLANLVNNAVQAMPNGGKLAIITHREANIVVISVEDTGGGIPEDIKHNLFTPLFTTKSKGQGFGLAVVKRMTEALGGTVTFESEIGKGTKFIVQLPSTNKPLK
ncbi:MAG: ATP-binding protein [Candidatus Bathyarchaeota archaeon]|nr:ATP-binding protein [Candidatus Bathyarchaeota archaeon]